MSKFTQPWGWSKLDTFRQCPRKFKYQYIDKLDTGKPGPALVRGSRIHDDIDCYLKGWEPDLPKEAFQWNSYINDLKVAPNLTGENGLGFDKDWAVLPDWFHPTTWLRAKVDARYDDVDFVKIIDWKTGKYRQPSTDQLKLYAATAKSLVPTAKTIHVEMVYIDQFPKKYTAEYDEADIPLIRRDFEKEAQKLYESDSWPAQPSRACRWCPFSKHNGGPCEY